MKSIKLLLIARRGVRADRVRRFVQGYARTRGRRQRRRQLASGFVEFAPVRRRLPLVQRVRFVRHLPAALQARIRPSGRHVFLRQTHAQRPVQRQHPVGKRLIPGFVQRRRNTDDADQHFEHERRLGLRQGRNPVGDHLRRAGVHTPKQGRRYAAVPLNRRPAGMRRQPFTGLRRFGFRRRPRRARDSSHPGMQLAEAIKKAGSSAGKIFFVNLCQNKTKKVYGNYRNTSRHPLRRGQ